MKTHPWPGWLCRTKCVTMLKKLLYVLTAKINYKIFFLLFYNDFIYRAHDTRNIRSDKAASASSSTADGVGRHRVVLVVQRQRGRHLPVTALHTFKEESAAQGLVHF